MQEIMDQILEGNFGYENGSLDFSCAKLELNIPVGGSAEGTFRIRSASGCPTDGYVTSDHLYMECLTPRFSGPDEEISFCFHGEHLEEGDVVKGVFGIVSNHGEYYLPYVVTVEHTVLSSSIGAIKNLFHFANLAKSDWREALQLFYSSDFLHIFAGSDERLYDVYRGLSANPQNEQNMEEFLIRINKKQRVDFLVEEPEITVEPVFAENSGGVIEQEISIVRNGWGYTSLNIECDGEFLFTEKELLSDDDFLGNRCRLPVFIDVNLCRSGRNFGQIVLFDSNVCLTVPVTVTAGEMGKAGRAELTKRRITVRLMEFYQDFRLKKINSATWRKETGKLVDRLVAMDENDVPSRLFQAQLLISEERYNEAKWILDHAMSLLEQRDSQDDTLLSYYWYLTTLIRRDEDYVNQVAEKVRQIYRMNHFQWRAAWLLLYLSPEYDRSASGKWLFLEKQFYYGCTSPVLYIEGLCLLNNNPALLHRLDAFELQVLYYGVKKQALGAELLEQVLYLTGRVREYSSVLFRILSGLYEKKNDVRLLQEICTLLIKGGKAEQAYFVWYEKGVQAQLRITNLYEYYMMALDLEGQQPLPKILLMYFSYQNNLDYEHSAYLYDYLVRHREEFPELYESYQIRIERFVLEQIRKRHINRNLAGLYQNMLNREMITEETAEPLSELLFANQVQTEDTRLRKVIVYQEGNSEPREYALQDGRTWIALYGSNYTILFEDGFGNRFVNSVEYTLEKLMMPGKFLRMLGTCSVSCTNLDLYLCETEHWEVTAQNLERVLRVADAETVASQIRRELYLKILQYYYDADDMQGLDRYLDQIPFGMLSMEEKGRILQYMVLRGQYDTAYGWVCEYGPYFADAKVLMRLIGEMMRQKDLSESVPMTFSARYVFRKGKYDSTILSYLARHFQGTTKEMRDIWKASGDFGVDRMELSEKMIVQMLYSGAFVGEKMDIFRYYLSGEARIEVKQAFLEQCCYDTFVRERVSDGFVFSRIREDYLSGEEISPVCKLAFLKYYAENPEDMSGEDTPLTEAFLREMLDKGIYLNFFRELKGMSHLTRVMNDKTIVEYRARPGAKVRIHYVLMYENGEADEYLSEAMEDVCGGVCFKDFVLFFGESLQYYITEGGEEGEQLTESGNLQKSDIAGEASRGNRYDMINDMVISKTLGDYDTLDHLLEYFFHKEYGNGELFQLM